MIYKMDLSHINNLAIINQPQKGDLVKFIKSKGPIGAKIIEMVKLQVIDSMKYHELLKSTPE